MTRLEVLRPHLYDGVPVTRAATAGVLVRTARRWLTSFEVVLLVRVKIHQLTVRVSVLKIFNLLINCAMMTYRLCTHRLLGVRGGGRADQAEKDRDTAGPRCIGDAVGDIA